MVLSSMSTPCMSGQLNRDINTAEMDETILNKKVYSIPVQPVDILTDTDKRVDIRLIQGRK